MKTITLTRDLLTGLLLLAVAVFFLFASRQYALGTPRQMGPAFFPVTLAVLLALIGLALCVRGMISGAPDAIAATISPRPIVFIMMSIGSFGVLLRPAGLVLALTVSLLIAVFARRGATLLHALATVSVLVLFGTVLFHYLLQVSTSLWPAFLS